MPIFLVLTIRILISSLSPLLTEYGHFTQVVWKGTKEVGIGIASDGKNQCIVVGSYRPAGNMMGDFSDHVPPPF